MKTGPKNSIPAPQDWNVERLAIGCSETEPIDMDAYTYTETQHFEFDMHYCLELGIVLEGTMERYYQSGRRSYQPGEIWLCGMWEPHGWAIRFLPAKAIVLFLHPPLVARTFFREGEELNWLAPFTVPVEDRPQIPPERRDDVLRVVSDLQAERFQNPSLRKIALHLKTLELIGILLDCWKPRPMPRRHSFADFDCIGTAMRLVFESHSFVTASDAARVCGLNRNALSRLFADYTGISFAEFALRYRVSSAAEELRVSEQPIKAVAGQWGFADTSHFFRAFVKFYGCPPTDYRKRARASAGNVRNSRGSVDR